MESVGERLRNLSLQQLADPAAQDAIVAAQKAHGLHTEAGRAFILSNIVAGRAFVKFSDLHPLLGPDDVLKAIPVLAERFQPATPAPDMPCTTESPSARSSRERDVPRLGRPGSPRLGGPNGDAFARYRPASSSASSGATPTAPASSPSTEI